MCKHAVSQEIYVAQVVPHILRIENVCLCVCGCVWCVFCVCGVCVCVLM